MQFKVFVLAEGVFQVPLRTFVLALVLGRGVRYFAEGIFAVRYGQGALTYLVSHAGLFILMVAGLLVLIYLANRLVLHTSPAEE
jgi:uncharacterized membrane protein YdjX (TVP38/TMEM64 family)